MKKIFIFFLALIFINLSCEKPKKQILVTKKYFKNQTGQDLSLTFFNNYHSPDDISINLLKNSSDSFESRFYIITGHFESSFYRDFYYKNKEFNFNGLKINFNSKKIELYTNIQNKDSFFKIPIYTFDTSNNYFYDFILNEFFFSSGPNTLYLLPRLYDSAK